MLLVKSWQKENEKTRLHDPKLHATNACFPGWPCSGQIMVLLFPARLHVTQTRISLTDRPFSTEAHPPDFFFLLGMLTCRAERLSACCSYVLRVTLHCPADPCILTNQPADAQLWGPPAFGRWRLAKKRHQPRQGESAGAGAPRGGAGSAGCRSGALGWQQRGAAVRDSPAGPHGTACEQRGGVPVLGTRHKPSAV